MPNFYGIAILQNDFRRWTNMDAFFQKDSRIQEWTDQIVEKILTYCLLSGRDAESEFISGRKLVRKLASQLLEIPGLTTPLLLDALCQLVDQRLPDPRVIENFRIFHKVKMRMIQEGLQEIYGEIIVQPAVESSLQPDKYGKGEYTLEPLENIASSKIVLVGGKTPSMENVNSNVFVAVKLGLGLTPEQILTQPPISEEKMTQQNKFILETSLKDLDSTLLEEKSLEEVDNSINDLDSIFVVTGYEHSQNTLEIVQECQPEQVKERITEPNITDTLAIISNQNCTENEIMTNINESISNEPETHDNVMNQEALAQEGTTLEDGLLAKTEKPLGIQAPNGLKINIPNRQSPMPKNAERLAIVLRKIKPSSQIHWNFLLAGHSFLAQVEKLLIYIEDSTISNRTFNSLIKEGWQICICSSEDLAFPRRLEREIHRTLHVAKKRPN